MSENLSEIEQLVETLEAVGSGLDRLVRMAQAPKGRLPVNCVVFGAVSSEKKDDKGKMIPGPTFMHHVIIQIGVDRFLAVY